MSGLVACLSTALTSVTVLGYFPNNTPSHEHTYCIFPVNPRYPVGTMLFQSLCSMLVGLECILRFTPDVYCDTMGAAFTYPVVHYLSGAKVVAYVHYPIISTVSGYCVVWCFVVLFGVL